MLRVAGFSEYLGLVETFYRSRVLGLGFRGPYSEQSKDCCFKITLETLNRINHE